MVQEPLRFAVVGLGAFGETYLECLRGLRDIASIETTAICSQSSERARTLATQYGVPHWYTDVEDLARDPHVDVVCVVTAEQFHYRPTLAALSAGKDVIVEKPLATSLAHADEMILTSRQTKRRLLVGQLLRFEVSYRSLAAQLHGGELGALVSLQSRRNRPAESVKRYRRTHPIFETGILDIDVMIWLAKSRVHRVRAFSRTVNPGPTPDLMWGVMEFESGAIGCVETSWLAPDAGGLFVDDALSVIGTQGTARIDLSRGPLSVWNQRGHRQPDLFYEPRLDGAVGGALREQLMYFVRCIREGRESTYVPLADVRHGVAVAEELVRSAEEGADRSVPSSASI